MPTKKSTQDVTAEQKPTFTLSDGRVIGIKPMDMLFLNTVMKSVKMPKKPTYEVKVGNRVEHYDMDEEAAKETPGGLELWRKYRSELLEAETEQGTRMLRAIIVDGTVRPENLWEGEWGELTGKWEQRLRLIGLDVPSDPDQYWVDYLTMTMEQADVTRLTSAIARLNNVPEELIAAAEESFRDTL